MFFGLLQYIWDGKKYLPEGSLTPDDPLTEAEKKTVIKWAAVIVIALVAVLGLMAVFHSFNVNGVINLITMIAIAMPIVYFVMMLHSKKVTKLERKRVVAYIPLFIAAAIFWGIEESGSVVLALFAEQRTVLHIGGGTLPPLTSKP